MKKWFAQAPSNIALIKYMGKENSKLNLPLNSSLSYTLPNLLSSVELEYHPGKKDNWEPLDVPGALQFSLPIKAQARFLEHLQYLKEYFKYDGAFIVRSCNNFPMSSGLASSASSFAALTLCAVRALSELTKQSEPEIDVIASLSRRGSGSSCRSFYAPWALWKEDKVKSVDLPYADLIHQVIIISHEEKKIPSTSAHELVKTSNIYSGRKLRAQNNLRELINAFENKDWKSAFTIVWREFFDMHKLFETSSHAFSYMNQDCQDVLNQIKDYWDQNCDGPLVTMDAGPNIHLLYRPDQKELAITFMQEHLQGNFDII